MKILHLLCTSSFSGAENVAFQIINMMNDIDNLEFIYCSPTGDIRRALEKQNIKHCLIKQFSYSEVKRAIEKIKPDIIHAHDMKASFFAALVCGKIPLISHIHNNNLNARVFSLKSILYLIANSKIKKIIWVSNSSYEGYFFHKILKNKSLILYNIINKEKILHMRQLDENQYNFDVIYLGRLSKEKNPQMLIKVIAEVVKIRGNIKFAIVGTGELENEIKELVSKLHLNKNIVFFGFKENPFKILSDSKILIMTSIFEGTPMCALEAMAFGLPIVSTPTDGLKDLIVDGETGFLESNILTMAQRVIKLLDNDELYANFQKNTKKRFLQLIDLEKYKSTIYNIYQEQYITSIGEK